MEMTATIVRQFRAVESESASTMVESASEAEKGLVQRATRGDKEAYRQLVERYQSRVYALAFAIVKNREDAEDIAQESFVKAYLSLPEFKGQSGFFTWLYRIAYNMAIDYRRRVARRGLNAVEFDEGRTGPASDLNVSTGGFVEGPQESALRKEKGRQIQQVLSQLSDEHRAVITLREVDGLSYEEIAEVVGISKGTVMSRLHYARKRLQKALREFAPDGVLLDHELAEFSHEHEVEAKQNTREGRPPDKFRAGHASK